MTHSFPTRRSSDLLRQSTRAESALDVRPRNSPSTRRLKGPGTVPSSIRPYMHTHRRADSCQRAAVLHRGRRVKTRPALARGSEDVAAQVLVLHQLAQVLVDVGAVGGDGAALVVRLEAPRVEPAFAQNGRASWRERGGREE